MSFAGRLIHHLTIVRTTFDDDEAERDEYQQPAQSIEEIEVRGLVQPRSAQEIADSRSAGAEVADHVVFLEPITVYSSDALVWNETGKRLAITGIRSFLMGRSPHHEIDAMTVTAATFPDGAS